MMKVWTKLALMCVLSSVAMANTTTLLETMRDMENGLSNVQKGFLYNNPVLIKEGVDAIHAANALFNNMDETKRFLPREKQHLSNVALNASKRINTASTNLLKAVEKKQFSKASQSYSELVNACTACHGVVRGW
ncbi:MAG: hypothetical protein Q8N01_05165 [Sulfuricurvum sp.]|nr:hypothetical protein [Sulfuricurvum sp.]